MRSWMSGDANASGLEMMAVSPTATSGDDFSCCDTGSSGVVILSGGSVCLRNETSSLGRDHTINAISANPAKAIVSLLLSPPRWVILDFRIFGMVLGDQAGWKDEITRGNAREREKLNCLFKTSQQDCYCTVWSEAATH